MHTTSSSSDSGDDFTKPWFVACCVFIILFWVYILACARHQDKLMIEKYGHDTTAHHAHR